MNLLLVGHGDSGGLLIKITTAEEQELFSASAG